MVLRTKPPFRADHVGSILRTPALKDARAKREKNEITTSELGAIEDREIAKIINKQEEIGLEAITDGEFRRSWWHYDFFGMLDGVEIKESDHGIQFQGIQTKMRVLRVTAKINFSSHPMIEHFKFLKARTSKTPKMAIPSPTVMHFRLEPDSVSKDVYSDRDAIFGSRQSPRFSVLVASPSVDADIHRSKRVHESFQRRQYPFDERSVQDHPIR